MRHSCSSGDGRDAEGRASSRDADSAIRESVWIRRRRGDLGANRRPEAPSASFRRRLTVETAPVRNHLIIRQKLHGAYTRVGHGSIFPVPIQSNPSTYGSNPIRMFTAYSASPDPLAV